MKCAAESGNSITTETALGVVHTHSFPLNRKEGCERKFAHSLLLFSCDLRMNIASETENGYFTAFTSATQASCTFCAAAALIAVALSGSAFS